MMNRRSLLASTLFAFAEFSSRDWAGSAHAQRELWRHGLSLFGELKYPSGFKRFDYVNPSAPKGGRVRQVALGTFDNFNIALAGVKGALAEGIGRIYDRLFVPALDEPSSTYGLLAESASYPSDYSAAAYRLRPEARWHDGVPVTPEDVIFSFAAVKKYSPQQSAY
jgi:microcin C transport system substrate-binding protein